MGARQVLSQEEINALLDGVDRGGIDTKPAAQPCEVRPYEIAQQARIQRGRMPTLDMINERFGRFLRTGLFNLLRRSVDVNVAPVEILHFGEYAATLPVPSSLNLVRLKPLRGTALVTLDSRLVFAVVDSFFGGNGRLPRVEAREFTPAERRIIDRLVQRATTDLREAWSPLLAIEAEHVASEINPHFATIASPSESVVVTRLQIELDGGGGALHVVVPYAAVEPLRDVLEAGVQSDRLEADERWMRTLREEIEDADVGLSVVLGSARVTIEQLLDLKAGDVLPCDFEGKVSVCSEGVPLFRGSVGRSRGVYAVSVDGWLQSLRTKSPDNPSRRPS